MASLTSPPVSLRGARHPRVELAPAYADTYGPEACALMASAGKPLDGWQQDALRLMLAVREDGRWACPEYAELVPRQNGKGAILEARALAGLLLLGEGLIMWSAHEYKTAMEAFRRVTALVRALGEPVSDNLVLVDGLPVKIINTNGEESLERLDTGARVKFVARSKGSGRGFSADCNVIDEAFAYTHEQHAALLPTLSARPNAQIVYTSSPPLTSDTGEVLFGLRRRASTGEAEGLGYRDWGAAGDLAHLEALDLDDQALWAAANPALGVRISLETLARLRRSLAPVDFAREVLGVWPPEPATGAGALDPARWAALADLTSQPVGRVALAVDTTPDRAWTAIAVAGRRADGLRHIEVIEHRPGTSWVVPRVLQLVQRWDPCAVVIDAAGPAGAFIAALGEAQATSGLTIEVVTPSSREVAQAAGALYDAVMDAQDLRHLDQDVLNAAVAGAQRRPLGEAWTWGRRGTAVDISPLVAVTLAAWGYQTRGTEPEPGPPNLW